MPSTQTEKWYRKQARKLYHEDGVIEVDASTPELCKVSTNDGPGDSGAYVQCWVWVPDPE